MESLPILENWDNLNGFFSRLAVEKDGRQLLSLVLLKAIELTQAERGVLFVLDEQDGGMVVKNAIRSTGGDEVLFEHLGAALDDRALCGYVAIGRKILNVGDGSGSPYLPNVVAERLEPGIRSLLMVPLQNTRRETMAVLQLENKKTGAFTSIDEILIQFFVTRAAPLIENEVLRSSIPRILEGFVRASVATIEAHDPSTGGHCERVAKLCVALAHAVNECQTGTWKDTKFTDEQLRELEFAALVHDFGKICVRSSVFVKAKKLYPQELEAIRYRILGGQLVTRIRRLELQTAGADTKLIEEFQAREQRLESFLQTILVTNEPSVLQERNRELLDQISKEILRLEDGSEISLLTNDEYEALSVERGSLSPSERLEIEAHVTYSYEYLRRIPWTRDLEQVPEIAFSHHEKLNGTGYPRKLRSKDIPVQAKIMTIVDIFDALSAADRSYKKAVSTERALEIVSREVDLGQLDRELFELFVANKVYQSGQ
jgi:HD-GYP domain-containing protein (c-di-GMP phosphodiesterase class II)